MLFTKHQLWLLKKGLPHTPDKSVLKKQWQKDYEETMIVKRNYKSGGMSGAPCLDKSIMTNLHKESPETQAAILEKASRVMPLFNKGGLQLASKKESPEKRR